MSAEGRVAVFVGKVLLAVAAAVAVCGSPDLALPLAVTGFAFIGAGTLA